LCTTEAPPARELAPGHTVLCHFPVIDERPAGSGPRVDVVKAPTPSVAALSASDVVVSYGSRQVLHEVGFTLAEGECLAIVGESGSGKTTLTRALVGLVAPGGGDIRLDGDRLAGLAADRTDVQRKKLQIIFQNPYASLNPRRTVGDSVSAPARFLFGESRRDARARAQEALRLVALSPKLVDAYPDQISGGERQRVAIARALICEPEVLVCDEVTSALDVSIQASIVNLLIRLKEERGLGLIFVTHNLPLVASLAERTLVLYQGRVVESDDTSTVLGSPSHPYTKSLLSDTPQPQFT
jgi:peptide/nickel transport system ATP-binding protein